MAATAAAVPVLAWSLSSSTSSSSSSFLAPPGRRQRREQRGSHVARWEPSITACSSSNQNSSHKAPTAESKSAAPECDIGRRHAIAAAAALAISVSTSTSAPPPASAAAAIGDGRSVLQRVFGMGASDLYYPEFFNGTWECVSTLVTIETPQGEDKMDANSLARARRQLNTSVKYMTRFFPREGHIIADRESTSVSLTEATVGKGIVTASEWNPAKPNRVVLRLKGGFKVESLVTRRSIVEVGPGRLDTSEFSKQVIDNGQAVDGPPTVKASQNYTKYKWDPRDQANVQDVEAIQRIAMFPVPVGDQRESDDIMEAMSSANKPITVYRYYVRFHKISDS
eukprot:jgi/Chlat1/1837/Chrsp14S00775